MGKPFTVNINRYDPYKTYRFLVYFGTSTSPVAAVSKVGGLKRSSDVIEYKEGGNPVILKGLGRTKYEPITLERGLTHDQDFVEWANASQVLDKGAPKTSLKNLRREVRIDLLNEEGQPVWRFLVHRCWVSEYQALARSRCGRERHRARAYQARKRRLGTGHLPRRARRAVSDEAASGQRP
jgi:phage tail-like protein